MILGWLSLLLHPVLYYFLFKAVSLDLKAPEVSNRLVSTFAGGGSCIGVGGLVIESRISFSVLALLSQLATATTTKRPIIIFFMMVDLIKGSPTILMPSETN